MMTGVALSPAVITEAKGTRLDAANGLSIFDFTSGQLNSLSRRSITEIVKYVKHYVLKLYHLFSDMIPH